MKSRRDLLRWLSTASLLAPLLAPLLARSEGTSHPSPPGAPAPLPAPHPARIAYPDEAQLRKLLDAKLATLRKVPLGNGDAPDPLPRAGALAAARPGKSR